MTAFKAYDIRAKYPEEINEELAYNVGRALVTYLGAKTLVVGRDCRESSPSLHKELLRGITQSGCSVIDVGLVSTPQLYFAIYANTTVDGGVMITASHNSKEYNGFKICKKRAVPLFGKDGFAELQQLIATKNYVQAETAGNVSEQDIRGAYTAFFKEKVKPLHKEFRILIDCGNGMGTKEVEVLHELYSENLVIDTLYEDMDGTFPHHEANPIKEDQMVELKNQLSKGNYTFGVGFDGDADRIAFFLNDGTMIPPDLITGILGVYLAKGDQKVGYEVRTSQAVEEVLVDHHIVPMLYPSGHAFIKAKMREDKTLFAGEKSGHYFYQELHYTDSPLYTLMHLLHLLDSKQTKNLLAFVEPLEELYVGHPEINYTVKDADAALKIVEEFYFAKAQKILKIDGLSVYTESYFFNIRKSNTEALVRLNIEGTGPQVVEEVKEQIERLIL